MRMRPSLSYPVLARSRLRARSLAFGRQVSRPRTCVTLRCGWRRLRQLSTSPPSPLLDVRRVRHRESPLRTAPHGRRPLRLARVISSRLQQDVECTRPAEAALPRVVTFTPSTGQLLTKEAGQRLEPLCVRASSSSRSAPRCPPPALAAGCGSQARRPYCTHADTAVCQRPHRSCQRQIKKIRERHRLPNFNHYRLRSADCGSRNTPAVTPIRGGYHA